MIGIVLSSLNWWRGEWIGLTLGIKITSLIREIVTEGMHTCPKNEFVKVKFDPVIGNYDLFIKYAHRSKPKVKYLTHIISDVNINF